MNIQWYPGHMTKARRAMEQDIKLVDLVVEVLDARMPDSSRNPDLDRLGQGKLRIVLLNKSDLADPGANAVWTKYFEEKGILTVLADSRKTEMKRQMQAAIAKVSAEKVERDRKRGILNRPVRAMVVGVPNVGKSTFINSFAGRASAKTGNKPGVTKGNQWIRLSKGVELLDTPGILWPKLEDERTGVHLAMTGSVNDEIVDREELACVLLTELDEHYHQLLTDRYGEFSGETSYDRLKEIAILRGCLLPGGVADTAKAARLILDDFRSGKLGRITLEWPAEEESADKKETK